MTILGPPAPQRRTSGGRRDVVLLSGFLGSGKTTLLRAELERSKTTAPDVVVNDFAEPAIDDFFLAGGEHQPLTVANGCACCNRRDELAAALRELLDAEHRRDGPTARHIVIETSGLSDPGPIAFTLANDPVLKHHYVLSRVCVTVDALTARSNIERHPVALRQLIAADDILVTKADLVTEGELEHLVAGLRELNSFAELSVTANGELLQFPVPGPSSAEKPAAGAPLSTTHNSGVSTLELVTEQPLDWHAFSVWLSLLLHRRGPDVLRVKGLLEVQNAGTVAINGVQHIMHPPEHLEGRASPGTRLVFIVQDMDAQLLERSFLTFLASGSKE